MAKQIGTFTIHEVVPGLDAWCSASGVHMMSTSGSEGAALTANLHLSSRDAVLRLASILAEAAEAMPVVEVSNG